MPEDPRTLTQRLCFAGSRHTGVAWQPNTSKMCCWGLWSSYTLL